MAKSVMLGFKLFLAVTHLEVTIAMGTGSGGVSITRTMLVATTQQWAVPGCPLLYDFRPGEHCRLCYHNKEADA